ncbi:MAG: hypothetical protein U0797_05030 [Gemmataceae bacterium]
MSEQHPAPELAALADELRRLAPREPALDRDATLFRAGRASATRGWLWPAAAAASSLTAVLLGGALYLQPPPQAVTVETRVAFEPAYPAVEVIPREESPVYEGLPPHRRLQEHLLRWGLDGLEPPPPSPPAPGRPYSSYYSDFSRGEPAP